MIRRLKLRYLRGSARVNRERRSLFSFLTVGTCVAMAMGLALSGKDTETARRVADGLIGLSEISAGAYVGASSVDWVAGKFGRRPSPSAPNPEPDPAITNRRPERDDTDEPCR